MSRSTTARSSTTRSTKSHVPARKSQATSRPEARRFALESLEDRQLMAGNVDVTLQNGNLLITGDNAGNGVQIRQISANKLAIVGIKQAGANTTVNGQGFAVISGVTGSVTFNMNGGNDQVDVSDGQGFFASQPGLPSTYQPVDFARNVTINMGDGNDLVAMEDADVNGSLSIDTGFGAGQDIVKLDGVTATGLKGPALEIDTNGGNDDIDIIFSEFRGLVDIDLGAENDTLDLQFVDIENGGDLVIRGQAGDDVIRLFALDIADDLLIEGGNDDDLVAVVEVDVQDEVDIRMGFGTDTLQLFALTAADAELDGGPGTDTLEDGGQNVFGVVDVDSFEVIVDAS